MPTALIVEDEPQANNLLALLLQLRGYQTESAYSGAEALEKIRQRCPDVVFLDLMLPDMDGYEVCRSLKSPSGVSIVPVVIVTARLTAENRIESFGAGADDYIPKPYTPDQIFEALEQSDAWKGSLDVPRLEGEIPLDGRDSGDALRRLAHLRRLLIHRCALESAEIDRITGAIAGLWASVNAWARQRRVERVATLSYSLTPEALTLVIQDEAGWLPGSGRAAVLSSAGLSFDPMNIDEQSGTITLVKRCGPAEASP